jgi:hypothetical protein
MRKGRGCVEGREGVNKNSGGSGVRPCVFRQGWGEGRSGKPGVGGGPGYYGSMGGMNSEGRDFMNWHASP